MEVLVSTVEIVLLRVERERVTSDDLQLLHAALGTLVDSLDQEREGAVGDGASNATNATKLVRKRLPVVFLEFKNLLLFAMGALPAARGDQFALEVRGEDLYAGLGEEGGREGV